jgi:UDPglucose 6-dehydrogenase
LAQLADSVGADIEEVKKGFTSDSRINPAFFYPGVGYGGSCFPKDVKALIRSGQENGVAMSVVAATDKVNEHQKTILTQKIKTHYKNVKGLTFTLWGLAFKPRTDDVREAPAFAILDELLAAGATIKAYDPVAVPNSKKVFGDKVQWFEDSYEALKNSDGLIIATEWNEFRSPEFEKMKSHLRQPIIFDGRNIFDPDQVRKLGFTYYCIGRDKI